MTANYNEKVDKIVSIVSAYFKDYKIKGEWHNVLVFECKLDSDETYHALANTVLKRHPTIGMDFCMKNAHSFPDNVCAYLSSFCKPFKKKLSELSRSKNSYRGLPQTEDKAKQSEPESSESSYESEESESSDSSIEEKEIVSRTTKKQDTITGNKRPRIETEMSTSSIQQAETNYQHPADSSNKSQMSVRPMEVDNNNSKEIAQKIVEIKPTQDVSNPRPHQNCNTSSTELASLSTDSVVEISPTSQHGGPTFFSSISKEEAQTYTVAQTLAEFVGESPQSLQKMTEMIAQSQSHSGVSTSEEHEHSSSRKRKQPTESQEHVSRKEYEELQTLYAKARDEINLLLSDKTQLTEKLANFQNNGMELKKELEATKEEKKKLEEEKKVFEEEKKLFEKKMDIALKGIKKVKDEKAQVELEMKNIKNEKIKQQEENEKLNKSVTTLTQEIQRLESLQIENEKFHSLGVENQKLQQQINEMNIKHTRQDQAYKTLATILEQYMDQIKQWKKLIFDSTTAFFDVGVSLESEIKKSTADLHQNREPAATLNTSPTQNPNILSPEVNLGYSFRSRDSEYQTQEPLFPEPQQNYPQIFDPNMFYQGSPNLFSQLQ